LPPRPTLVLYDSVEPEQIDGRRVRVHFNLKATFLAWCYGCPVAEAQCFQPSTEGDDVPREWTAKITGVATGVKAPEVAIQLALGRSNASLVTNDQGSVNGRDRTTTSGLGLNPA